MQPLVTTAGCLKCQGNQGYNVGDIRGGVSLSVPMLELRAIESESIKTQRTVFLVLWLSGLFFIWIFINKLQTIIEQRMDLDKISEKHEILEKHHTELSAAMANVKLLSGLLPICASCKKIRDDQGYWNHVEMYVKEHSMAEFTHGICPECAEILYPGAGHSDEED